jgi:hypothetical protein
MRFEDALISWKELVNKIGYNQAYLVVAVAVFIEESDVDALASIGLTEGANDKKIDFIYHDKEARRLVFAQGYMSKKIMIQHQVTKHQTSIRHAPGLFRVTCVQFLKNLEI